MLVALVVPLPFWCAVRQDGWRNAFQTGISMPGAQANEGYVHDE